MFSQPCAVLYCEESAGFKFFQVQVLLIEAENREPPGDILIVTQRHSGQSWLSCADHIPSRRDQMHHVPQRWLGDNPVRIVCQQRFSAAGQLA